MPNRPLDADYAGLYPQIASLSPTVPIRGPFLPDGTQSRMMRERRTLDHRTREGEESPGFIGSGGG
jgi:hypothetical protein